MVKPWLTTGAIEFLETYIDKDKNILEFGAGNSTIWFASRTDHIITIEHDPEWYQKIKEKVKTEIRLLPRPYAYVCDGFPDEHFDFVLVDGRDRVKCIERIHPKIKHGGILMLDNSEREEYQSGLQILKEWKMTDAPGDWHTAWWIKP